MILTLYIIYKYYGQLINFIAVSEGIILGNSP